MEPLPYEERFWRSDTLAAVKSFAPPVGVQGFVCALPANWTRGEKIKDLIIARVINEATDS